MPVGLQNHFEQVKFFSHWARLRPLRHLDWTLVETGTLARLDVESVVSPLDVTGAQATAVGLRVTHQQAGFRLPDAVVGSFGLPPICHPAVRLRCPLSSFGVSIDC